MGNTQVKGSNYAIAIVVACIAFYAVPVGLVGNQAGLFTTPVMEQFGWSQTEATLYMSIQPWVAAIFTPIAGKVLNKCNPRWVLTLTSLAFGLSSLACAWFTEPWMWHCYGVIYGISAAFFMYIAVPTMVNRWFVKHNGFVIGFCGAFISILAAIMSPVIQTWISSMGWQQARIIINVACTVISVVLTFALLRPSPESMGLKPFGYDPNATEAAAADPSKKPGCTPAEARKSPALYMLMLVAGFFVISASFVQQLSRYCSTMPELGAAVGALAVSIAMVGGIVGKFGLGWICDRFGSRTAGVTAGALGAIGVLICFFAGGNVTMFYVGVALFGVGYSALSTVPPMLCSDAFGQKSFTDIYSMVATALNVFSGFSALIYAQIFDITGSYNGAFWMIIIFYVLIVIMSLFIVPMGRRLWKK